MPDIEFLKGIGIIVGFIIVTIIAYFTGQKNNKNCENKEDEVFVTQKQLNDRENQYYNDFVKKESQDEFKKEIKAEISDIKKSQTDLSVKVNEIDKNVALLQKDFSYMNANISTILKSVEKRKCD